MSSLNYSIQYLQQKKNILFEVVEQLKKGDPQMYADEIIKRESEIEDIEKAIKVLEAANL